LNIAGGFNGQVVNMANIARDAELPRASVENYFGILEDTLLSRMLPAYSHKGKVRLSAHPKFYWFDSGVARAAAGWLKDPIDSVWKGFALETLILNELTVYNHVSGAGRKIAYYRTHTGLEIDFVIETRKATQHSPAEIVGIEIKLSNKWDRSWEKGLRSISEESETRLIKKIGVYTGDRSLYFDDMQVLPVQEFLRQLHAGEIFSKVID
jgi:predicted AAA+ superfamily ATPase